MIEEIHVITRNDIGNVAILTIEVENSALWSLPFDVARQLGKALVEKADEVERIVSAKAKAKA